MISICDRSEHITFSDLIIGEVYKFNNEFYMKIGEVLQNNRKYNSVHLRTGELMDMCQAQDIKRYRNVEMTAR